ncbi:MAG: SMP-30/gluconolactonase/LRE family protein [Solibacillus sp.]|uniref:SMP-30/gluconolactonase/LRE family protein n=1 Tax=unclassified Solibacillus TaxID=2637870 RepID=UPI0030FC463D
MLLTIQPFTEITTSLGESPVWDHQTSTLYWVDILEKKVYICNALSSNEIKTLHFSKQISSLALATGKNAIITLEDGFYLLDLKTGTTVLIQHVEKELLENRFNDGKCDASGRFFAGTMNKFYKHHQAGLYCLHRNFQVEQKMFNMNLANGIAWSTNNKLMYVVDSLEKVIYQFNYNMNESRMYNKKICIDFQNEAGYPDGITIDEQDMLWVAHWEGAKISRWNPKTSKKIDEIILPALKITSCTFGGKHLNELFITTASEGMSNEQLKKYPMSGRMFRIKLPISGRESYRYSIPEQCLEAKNQTENLIKEEQPIKADSYKR